MRTTIDYGIDLGTTNSAIAVLDGTEIQVLRDNENQECMPSCVYINRRGEARIGRAAYERVDNVDGYGQFKRLMGTQHTYEFGSSGRKMSPEDLSAEVLKELRKVAVLRRNEDVRAAVITVPAAFDLPQCDATQEAARGAGLEQSLLLQEPVAAAMAYGFQSDHDKVYWLVYDFGGGTFDAAVITIRDGVVQVVNHKGDKNLGGADIDRAIVDELLVPALLKERKLRDFGRANPKWFSVFARLKREAEIAKIRVSNSESEVIEVVFKDDDGEIVDFEYTLRRQDVEKLMLPLATRSINISREALSEKGFSPGDIERIILVGGPTQAPYLRNRLADKVEGLGIPPDFSVDPMTAVARGAAIFAGTQRITIARKSSEPDVLDLELDYQPVGNDPEPEVGGRVHYKPGTSFDGYTIEFVNNGVRSSWRSGKVDLSPEGTFVTTLWAEKGQRNVFQVELSDGTGSLRKTNPDHLTYTIDVVAPEPPLIHTVGVALANNHMFPFLEKGTPLPAKKRHILLTSVGVSRGQSADMIRVPVVEGENRTRGDRNRLIGTLTVAPHAIKRDVPAGSEVEVLIEIDASRLVRTKAYIPLLDEEFPEVLTLERVTPGVDQLRKDADAEKQRLDKIRAQVHNTADPTAQRELWRIDEGRMVHDLETSLKGTGGDPEAAGNCSRRLEELRRAIDSVEDAQEWPALVAKAKDEIKRANALITQHGDSTDRATVATLEREVQEAIDERDPELVRQKTQETSDLRYGILRELPGFWVGLLEDMEQNCRDKMTDRTQAEALFNQARRAIQNGDVQALRASVSQLLGLLPEDEKNAVTSGFGSTVLLG